MKPLITASSKKWLSPGAIWHCAAVQQHLLFLYVLQGLQIICFDRVPKVHVYIRMSPLFTLTRHSAGIGSMAACQVCRAGRQSLDAILSALPAQQPSWAAALLAAWLLSSARPHLFLMVMVKSHAGRALGSAVTEHSHLGAPGPPLSARMATPSSPGPPLRHTLRSSIENRQPLLLMVLQILVIVPETACSCTPVPVSVRDCCTCLSTSCTGETDLMIWSAV